MDALGSRSGEVPWVGRPLALRQLEAAKASGLEVGESADVISLSPGGCATDALLKRFRNESDGLLGDVVGQIEGPMKRWTEPPFGPVVLIRRRGGGPWTPEREAAATVHRMEVIGSTFQIPIAQEANATLVNDPVRLIGVHHWSGVLWTNLLSLFDHLRVALLGSNGPSAAWNVFRGLLMARSTDPWQVAGALSRYGKGVKVHPTAVVEGCTLGDRTEVGPGAVLRGSVVGSDCRIEPQAVVAFSVLADKVVVQRQGFVLFSVLDAESAVGGSMQLGVLGVKASVKRGAYLLDQSFSGPVRVRDRGLLVDVPLGTLGVGVGQGTVVGAGVQVAAGRTLPSDLRIFPSGHSLLRSIPDGVSGLCEVKDGRLLPAEPK